MTTACIPLRYILRPREIVDRQHLPVLSVYRDHGVVLKDTRSDNFNKTPLDLSRYQEVRPGDLVVNKMKAWQGSLAVSQYHGIVSPDYLVCSLSPAVHPQYLHYLLRSSPLIFEYKRRSKGIRPAQWRLYWADLAAVLVTIPKLDEQRQIADFLDAETTRIQDLTIKKRQLIQLLYERRQSFVSRVTTSGPPNVEPQPTGSTFAPMIPKHWRLMRMRHVVRKVIDTEHATAPTYEDGAFLVVRTSNVRRGRLMIDDARYTDEEGFRLWTRRGLPEPGDVLFTREAPPGEACIVPPGVPLCIGQRMVLLKVNREIIDPEWLVHSIYSGPAQTFIEVTSKSNTVAHLNIADVPDIPLVVPPLEEQKDLLKSIVAEVNKQEGLEHALVRQIALLHEHRQALVTAAVTGQIAIPGLAA